MKLKRFRIQKYKCIHDSGWVEVGSLTALAGKNESGKTSLLKALQKINPLKPEPYSLAQEWPRGLWGERDEAQVVGTADFQLDAPDLGSLEEALGHPVSFDSLQVSRNYAGHLQIHFPDGLIPEEPEAPQASGEELPLPPPGASEPFRRAAEECRAEVIRFCREGLQAEVAQLRARHETTLTVKPAGGRQPPGEHIFRKEYLSRLDALLREWPASQSTRRKAYECVAQRLPIFVYMDERLAFQGTAELEELKRRKDRHDLQPADETFLMILEAAELDFEKLLPTSAADGAATYEERQYDLKNSEATLNRKIQGHWGQLRYEVSFRVDCGRFMTFVKGARDQTLIRLEDRSKGFQWFFSFDLLLMCETQGRLKNSIILLDEPGLHLHPDGQRNLVERMADWARRNTLIYTTHLPFMLDLEEPDQLRLICEAGQGTVVTQDLTQGDSAARAVLEAALGLRAQSHPPVAQQTLLVETPGDYWILCEISNLFRRSGKAGLPSDAFLMPAGGARELTCLAALMAGHATDVLVIFNSTPSGHAAREKLVKAWLPKFPGRRVAVLDLAETAGSGAAEFSIEDIFPDNFYVARVQKAYEKLLPAWGISLAPLPASGRNTARVEAAFQAAKAPFDPEKVARRIAADLRQMKVVTELPDRTRLLAEKLFTTIAHAVAGD